MQSSKLETNQKTTNSQTKRYDLEERTQKFAKSIRNFVVQLPLNLVSKENIRQIVRSSGSIGANYLEANESLSKKDFLMRIKISKKETRETVYWLELLEIPSALQNEHQTLLKEANEIMNILGAILRNSS